MQDHKYDLIVVGGGPAGATVAALVAMAGHDVLLLERDRFPRYQVGESLLPATIHEMADVLGVRDQIQRESFPIKRGATFSWGADQDLWNMSFGGLPADCDDLEGVPFAHNVRRADFDKILLDNARVKGADIREGHRVLSVTKKQGRITGLRYEDAEGREREVEARFVADASGHQSRIASEVGTRVYSKFYRNVGVFCYYKNGKRLPYPRQGNVLFEAFSMGWIWYIPLTDELTSVGAVIHQHAAKQLQEDPERAMREFVEACPTIADYLSGARRVREGPYSGIKIRKEFSYCHSRFWSPGGVLLGDAACFVDVLLSSGVHIATYSALQAARSINTSLKGGDEKSCFNAFELRTRLEFTRFYECLIGLYDKQRDTETYQTWLRTYLQVTNGVFLDLLEEEMEEETGNVPDVGGEPVSWLREQNLRLLEYDGPPSMDLVAGPVGICDGLAPSPDLLHWVER